MDVTTVLFGFFIILLLIGTPIYVALGSAAMISFLIMGDNVMAMVQVAYNSVDSFPLMALPAFVLSGALMDRGGISKRLVYFAETIVSSFTGGISGAAILACMFFGAISGSGPATTAAVGMLIIPAMIQRGYSRGYAGGVTAVSGGLGVVIPPSVPMVIYGVAASVSITKLFVAGVFPGIILGASLLILNYFQCRKYGYKGSGEPFSFVTVLKNAREGKWALFTPVVILGGIYTGFFTPTEAAVVSIFYALFVGCVIHRELDMKGIMSSLEVTTWITGRVLIIMFAARCFGRLLVAYRVPDMIAEAMLALTSNIFIIWALVIIFLLFVGMFMETLATILLLTPVLLPVMVKLGIDPIHFGVVLVCCCEIGFSTPPLGENLFIGSGIAKVSIEDISAKALPFVFVCALCILLIAYVPQLTLWLPSLIN